MTRYHRSGTALVLKLAFCRSPVPHDPHPKLAIIRAPPSRGPDYSLALSLRDAGVSADVIWQYVNIEQAAAFDGLYSIAEPKVLAAQNLTDDR